MSKRSLSPSAITQIAVIAAMYAALTVVLSPLSYGMIQIRLAEALMMLCVCRKRWCVALSIGCAAANLFSGMPLDVLFGSLATVIAAFLMYRIKKPLPASLMPALVNGVIIGAELYFFMEVPFWAAFIGVAVGELISVMCIGVPLLTVAAQSDKLRKILYPSKPQP